MNKFAILLIAMICVCSLAFRVKHRADNDFGLGAMLENFQTTAEGMMDTMTNTVTDTNEAVSATVGDTADTVVETTEGVVDSTTETLGGTAE